MRPAPIPRLMTEEEAAQGVVISVLMTEWQRPSAIVGNQVKAIRQGRGWSVRRLVDECRSVGWTVTASQIENIEGVQRRGRTERRRVSVDELLALSYVLKVRPIDVLIPNEMDRGELYNIAPDVSVTTSNAYVWITGGFLNASEWEAELAEAMKWMPADEARNLMMLSLRSDRPTSRNR